MVFRITAACFAVGGLLWSLFCLVFVVFGDFTRSILLFGPGYLVTMGYVYRALWTPSNLARRVIWGLSALVQGAWLYWFITNVIEYGLRGTKFDFVALTWWTVTFAMSIYAFAKDVNSDNRQASDQEAPGEP